MVTVVVPAVVTVKSATLVAVPPPVVTLILPVVAPVGTVAVICVAEFTVNVVAVVALNLTLLAPEKFVPVMVTDAPTEPLPGVNEVIVGAGGGAPTVKSAGLVAVPPPVVTLIFPVVAPVGTVAVICVAEFTVNVMTEVALNFTLLAPPKLAPVMVTGAPTEPLVGENELIEGGSGAPVLYSTNNSGLLLPSCEL